MLMKPVQAKLPPVLGESIIIQDKQYVHPWITHNKGLFSDAVANTMPKAGIALAKAGQSTGVQYRNTLVVFSENHEGSDMKTNKLTSFLSSSFHRVIQRGPRGNHIHRRSRSLRNLDILQWGVSLSHLYSRGIHCLYCTVHTPALRSRRRLELYL